MFGGEEGGGGGGGPATPGRGALFGGMMGGCGGGGHAHGAATEPEQTVEVASDLERGLRQIRTTDSTFDEARFRETATDIFFRVQAAWGNRDLEPIRALFGPEVAKDVQAG